jgi:hypothetical protein
MDVLTSFVLFLITRGRACCCPAIVLLAQGAPCSSAGRDHEKIAGRFVAVGNCWQWKRRHCALEPVAPNQFSALEVRRLNRSRRNGGGRFDCAGCRDIPFIETDKPGTVILAGNYGEAGALDLYGAEYGLPRTISGANSLWARGYGDFEPETVIVVGFERGYADRFFGQCEPVGRVTNRYNVANEESTHHTGLYVCRQPRHPWNEMWQEMKWFQ